MNQTRRIATITTTTDPLFAVRQVRLKAEIRRQLSLLLNMDFTNGEIINAVRAVLGEREQAEARREAQAQPWSHARGCAALRLNAADCDCLQ